MKLQTLHHQHHHHRRRNNKILLLVYVCIFHILNPCSFQSSHRFSGTLSSFTFSWVCLFSFCQGFPPERLAGSPLPSFSHYHTNSICYISCISLISLVIALPYIPEYVGYLISDIFFYGSSICSSPKFMSVTKKLESLYKNQK